MIGWCFSRLENSEKHQPQSSHFLQQRDFHYLCRKQKKTLMPIQQFGWPRRRPQAKIHQSFCTPSLLFLVSMHLEPLKLSHKLLLYFSQRFIYKYLSGAQRPQLISYVRLTQYLAFFSYSALVHGAKLVNNKCVCNVFNSNVGFDYGLNSYIASWNIH